MNNFGEEMVTVNNSDTEAILFDRPVTQRLINVARIPAPKFLYFHPRVYLFGGRDSETLPPYYFPDGRVGRVLVFPERHTLWFARGATIQLEPNMVIVIRGSIRAERTMLFDLPEVRDRRTGSEGLLGSALVRIESTRVDTIYPEWFGAKSVNGSEFIAPNDAPGNTAAWQACLHAACRDRVRDGVSLPPLVIDSRGIFCVNDTLEALPDVNGRGALWLRSDGDATRRNLGIPTLTRYPRAVRPRGVGKETEDSRSSLLRLQSRVSVEISGVGLRVIVATAGSRGERDVAHAVLVEESETEEGVDEVPGRQVVLERCAILGGREAVLAVRPEPIEGVRLPSDLRDIARQRHDFPRLNRAVLSRKASYLALRESTVDANIENFREAVVANPARGIAAAPAIPGRSSRFAIDLDVIREGVAELTSCLVFQGKGNTAYFDERGRPFDFVDLEAGVRIVGLSTLIRAVSFHLAEGPRPSRPVRTDGRPDQPDGQDLWLASGERGHNPHLTVLHADSQSWWLLGGYPMGGRVPGAVSLLNVGAGDVNRGDLLELTRFESLRRIDDRQENRIFVPPCILWPESVVPLLLEACAFSRYCVRRSTSSLVVNVGSCFHNVTEASLARWLPVSAIPSGPQTSGADGYLASVVNGRLIPTPARLNREAEVRELPILVETMSGVTRASE